MKPARLHAMRAAAGSLARRAAARTAARAAGAAAASRLLSAATSAPADGGGGKKSWSETIMASLASSPEFDFEARADVALAARAFSSSSEGLVDRIRSDGGPLSGSMAYSLSFAGGADVGNLTDERQRRQLARAEEEATLRSEVHDEVAEYDTRRELLDERPSKRMDLHEDEGVLGARNDEKRAPRFEDVYAKVDSRPLPRNLVEATSPSEDRPVVVTETRVPFRIVAVNAPWEGLCGYTQTEARGRTLGDLLQGPETDQPAVTALVDKILHFEEAGTVLTNYTKDGRKFQNRLRVGTLKNDKDRVTHFVGVLREISESPDRFEKGQGKRMNA